MGQKASKVNPKKGKKVLDDIPPDSPLGVMIKYWDESRITKGKDKVKMINFCMMVWAGRKIRSDNLCWPKYGSCEGWMCQALNVYVNGKRPYNLEECEYAACWKG